MPPQQRDLPFSLTFDVNGFAAGPLQNCAWELLWWWLESRFARSSSPDSCPVRDPLATAPSRSVALASNRQGLTFIACLVGDVSLWVRSAGSWSTSATLSRFLRWVRGWRTQLVVPASAPWHRQHYLQGQQQTSTRHRSWHSVVGNLSWYS